MDPRAVRGRQPAGDGAYPEIRARWLLTGNGAPRIAAVDPARLVETGALSQERGSGVGGDGGADPEREGSAALERAYEAGRRDAVMEMM